MISHLLDTHILLWWRTEFPKLSKVQAQVLQELEEQGQPVGLSAISLREFAMMIHRRRISIDIPLEVWLDSIESHPLITILPLTTRIAAESVRLGDDFPRDPAVQIIVATARCHGLSLVTADERIRNWGKVNLV
jgi:PIN domain nuclease of toxin-antitoxin system